MSIGRDEGNKMEARIVCRDPPVLNQFLYDGGKGRVACMGICIQALYHLSEALRFSPTASKEDAILTPIQWGCVMSQGTRLWTLWRQKYPDMVEEFPLADDLFALPQCAGFYKLFKKEIVEYGGLARKSVLLPEAGEGTLQQLLSSLVNKQQYGYALITMPGNSTVAVLYRPQPFALFLFDPHGRAGTEDVTFLEFGDSRGVTQYLLRRYQVGCIDQVSDEIYSLYNEVELADAYTYSACLFTNETS